MRERQGKFTHTHKKDIKMALKPRSEQSLTMRDRKMKTNAEWLSRARGTHYADDGAFRCCGGGRQGPAHTAGGNASGCDASAAGLGKIYQNDTCTTYLLPCASSSWNQPWRCTPHSMKIRMREVIHCSQGHNCNILERALRPISGKGVA